MSHMGIYKAHKWGNTNKNKGLAKCLEQKGVYSFLQLCLTHSHEHKQVVKHKLGVASQTYTIYDKSKEEKN